MKKIQSEQIINLTRHALVLGQAGIEIPPSGQFARIVWSRVALGSLLVDENAEMPVVKIGPQGSVIGLPEAVPGRTYLVSPELRMFLTLTGIERKDVLSPFGILGQGEERFASALAT